jgi:DNA helicase II / ATP-dependent DNA helicase PcrA
MVDAVQRREQVLEGLDPEQREAVLAPPGPVRILAGAGTGKTRTITRRIAYLAVTGQVSPTAILAVTHSNQAAGELRDRIRSLGVSVEGARTFHGAAMRQLRFFWEETGLPGDRLRMVHEIAGGRRRLLRAALESVVTAVGATDVHDLESEIEWARKRLVAPEDYAAAAKRAGRTNSRPAAVLAAAYERYEQAKRFQAVLDFDDTIEQCAILLNQNEEVAEQVRTQYRCFVVDEYQDTDPAQERLLTAWRGAEDNVTVVGDPNQTIYSFKGADPSFLDGFADRYPGAVSISLDRDYRSTPQIVNVANKLMGPGSGGVVLKGQRPAGPEPVCEIFDTEAEEADYLTAQINGLIASGVSAAQIAVLVRTRSQVTFYDTVLRDAGVVTEVSDEEKFFDRPKIVEAMRLLADLAERSPQSTGPAGLRAVCRKLGFDPEIPPNVRGAARADWESLMALIRLAERMPDDVRGSVGALRIELRRRAEAEHAPRGGGGVTVATIHKAKGLEWDAVLLPGLTDGYLPIFYAKSPEEIEEERRLLYVAITRARERLALSYAARSDNGRNNSPSRFLSRLTLFPGSAVKKPAAVRSAYAVGDRVMSTAFGLGKVIEMGIIEMQVDFGGSYGIRTLRIADRELSRL